MTVLSEAQMKLAARSIAAAKGDRSFVEIGKAAGYNEKTVREALKGYPKKKKIVSDICEAVGVDLDEILSSAGMTDSKTAFAPMECGGYAIDNYTHHIGSYTTVRPAYANTNILKCYQTDIFWNDNLSRLRFCEKNRDDTYGQDGDIYIPAGLPCMYMITIKK